MSGLPVPDLDLTPRQFDRASHLVTSLLFKGINHFCTRDIDAYQQCNTFYTQSYSDGKLRPGQCDREKEMAAICRLQAAESLSVMCTHEIAALTQAIGSRKSDAEISALTDKVYACGLTPNALYTGERSELPAGMMRAMKRSIEQAERDETFKKVLAKQIENRANLKNQTTPAQHQDNLTKKQ